MDINKFLNSVNNLSEYTLLTQDLLGKYSRSTIEFNMSTIIALKKIKYLEIEYFAKSDENGAGFKILESMLRTSSKNWDHLAVELISLLQYWLEALRRHLIKNKENWWYFLKPLLQFIEKLLTKSHYIKNIIVRDIGDCLLDLATSNRSNMKQKHRIIDCFNACCTNCSREIRVAMRGEFKQYFIMLSSLMSSYGDVPTQYSILETLLRWLVPRHDPRVRREAAGDLFPARLYNRQCVDVFLEKRWTDFFDLKERVIAYSGNNFPKKISAIKHDPNLVNITEEEYSSPVRTVVLADDFESDKTSADKKEITDKRPNKESIERNLAINDNLVFSNPTNIRITDESFINETLQYQNNFNKTLNKTFDLNNDNILDLLANEAFQHKNGSTESINKENNIDSKILNRSSDSNNSCDVKSQRIKRKRRLLDKQTVISNTTTEESNFDVVEDTYMKNIHFEKKLLRSKENRENKYDTLSQNINDNINKETVNHTEEQISNDRLNLSCHVPKEPQQCKFDTTTKGIEKGSTECDVKLTNTSDVGSKTKQCSKNISSDIQKEVNAKAEPSMIAPNIEKPKLKINMTQHRKTTTKKKRTLRSKHNVKSSILLNPAIDAKQNSPKLNKRGPKNRTKIDNERQKDQDCETPLIRRKRKLYSPKDDDKIAIERTVDLSGDSENLLTERRTKVKNPQINTPCKEIESIKRKSMRNVRNKSSIKDILSPRSKRLGDIFDTLKDGIEDVNTIKLLPNEDIAEKIAIYNYTSDSSLEEFKHWKKFKENSNLNEENKSKVESLKSRNQSRKKKGSTRKRMNTIKNGKITKPNLKKNTTTIAIEIDKPDLQFERMRTAATEDILNVSYAASKQKNADEPEPSSIKEIEMQLIDNNDEQEQKLIHKQKCSHISKRKKSEVNKANLNMSKLIIIEVNDDDRENSVSPLPGLLVEALPPGNDERNDSITSNMLEALDKIVPKNNNRRKDTYSPHCTTEKSVASKTPEVPKKRFRSLSIKKRTRRESNNYEAKTSSNKSPIEIIHDSSSEKSIATVGHWPITGHGDFDEVPPCSEQLNERILEPRGLDVDDSNSNLKEYSKSLYNQMRDSSRSRASGQSIDAKINEAIVSVARISPIEINKLLLQNRNSGVGSESSSISGKNNVTDKTNNLKLKPKITPMKLQFFENDYKSPLKSKSASNILNIEATTKRYNLRSKKKKSQATNRNSSESQILQEKDIKIIESSKPKTKIIKSQSRVLEAKYIEIAEIKTDEKNKSSSKSQATNRNSSESQILQTKDIELRDEKNNSTSKNQAKESAKKRNIAKTKAKNRVVEEKIDAKRVDIEMASGTSAGTSVDHWMTVNENSRTASEKNVIQSYEDSLKIILEKLNTTLTEIDHNTQQKFVDLFVDMHKQIAGLKEERQNMFSNCVQLMKRQFRDIESRMQTNEAILIENFEKKSCDLLHDDRKQKVAMVRLLIEDIEAVRKHRSYTK